MKILIYSLMLSFIIINASTVNKQERARMSRYDWVQDIMSEMTLREKIAQMIITHSEGYRLDDNSPEFLRLKKEIQTEKVGGIIFFRGNSSEQAALINKLQSFSKIPLLISQDSERGTGMRLNDGSLFPNNMAIGAANDKELAYKMGLIIAGECRAIGVHQNYAPVMDINNNPDNPIINVRSFGEDPQTVSELGTSMIRGLQDGNVLATAKHFPGHGDTDIDSHSDLPVLNFGIDRLNRTELIPFQNSINAGVKSIMIAHLSLPALDGREGIPATLSPNIVKQLLIEEMGFEGLIVTDALNMEGITKNYTMEEIARLSVIAGIDLLLMPRNVNGTISAIEDAVIEGVIPEGRIDYSVKKILDAKKWLGLDNYTPADADVTGSIVNSSDAIELSQEIADKSITLVKNSGDIFPLAKNKYESCLIISMNNGNEKANSSLFLDVFGNRAGSFFRDFEFIDLSGNIDNKEEIIAKATSFELILVPIYAKVKMRSGTVDLPESQKKLINELKEKGKRVAVLSFGNPYLIKVFENIDSYICAYGDSKSSIIAGVKAMTGEIKFSGRLPVTISDKYKTGTGITN